MIDQVLGLYEYSLILSRRIIPTSTLVLIGVFLLIIFFRRKQKTQYHNAQQTLLQGMDTMLFVIYQVIKSSPDQQKIFLDIMQKKQSLLSQYTQLLPLISTTSYTSIEDTMKGSHSLATRASFFSVLATGILFVLSLVLCIAIPLSIASIRTTFF